MFLIKVTYRINSSFKKFFYKLLYKNKFFIGKSVHFRSAFKLVIEKNGKVIISDNVFFNNFCSINCLSQISIGKNTIFGENVHIYDHNHIYGNGKEVIKSGFTVDSIEIGENCWIGTNVTILKGVKIGNNAVIGANCVVSRDIESNTLYVLNRNSFVKINIE